MSIVKKKFSRIGLIRIISVAIVATCVLACNSTQTTMTRKLFMQSKRATIDLPRTGGIKGPGGTMTVSEEVTFTNADNYFEPGSKYSGRNKGAVDLSKDQELGEVVVTARSRFTPERNGKVNIDFVVNVPRELLSDVWRLTLSPEVLADDSVIALPEIVLKGKDFLEKQLQDYDNYQMFLNTLVDKSKYDSMFLDKRGIEEDIRNRQGFYWDLYHKEYQTQVNYEEWKFRNEDKMAYETAKKIGRRAELKNQYLRQAFEEINRLQVQGKDTTGVYNKYMARYEKEAQKLPKEWFRPELEEKAIPTKYREIHETGRTLDDLKNHAVTEKDSANIAKYRYEFEKIALNEAAVQRKEDIFKELVRFPLEDKSRLRVDSIADPDKNFTFLYKQDYPVTAGIKSLRVTMKGKVQAIDYSSYTLPTIDTLSYFISSLVQLADPSLGTKETKLYRNMFNRMDTDIKFAPGKTAFDANYKNNRSELDKVVSTYKSFTEEGGLIMDSIVLRVSTDLDGKYVKNAELAEKRSEALKNYLVKNTFSNVSNASFIFKEKFTGEDWNALAAGIRKRDDLMNKNQILNIISQATDPDQTEADIKQLYPGDFKVIKDSVYPQLNKVEFVFNMSRPNMTATDSLQVEVRDGYAEGIRLLQNREYWKALDILSNYPDFNLALCLTCMGYNAKAYELLQKLPATGNTEYLLAILSIRMEKEDEAIEHLLAACAKDSSKAFRIPLDPEINTLVRKHNLSKKIAALSE